MPEVLTPRPEITKKAAKPESVQVTKPDGSRFGGKPKGSEFAVISTADLKKLGEVQSISSLRTTTDRQSEPRTNDDDKREHGDGQFALKKDTPPVEVFNLTLEAGSLPTSEVTLGADSNGLNAHCFSVIGEGC